MNLTSIVPECQFDEETYAIRLRNAQTAYQRIIHELTQARRKSRLSQACLAAQIGVKQPRISEIEKLDTADVSFLRILLLSEFLGMEVRLSPKVTQLKVAMAASRLDQNKTRVLKAASAQKVSKVNKSQA